MKPIKPTVLMIGKQAKLALEEFKEALDNKWVFTAGARYGELVAALPLIADSTLTSQLENASEELGTFLVNNQDQLVSDIKRCTNHILQIIHSGYGLVPEELLSFCNGLSDLLFINDALIALNITELPISQPPSSSEVRDYLERYSHRLPQRWLNRSTAMLDCNRHWWWQILKAKKTGDEKP
jgi:hypothetical protein